jgi:hypothetical protein
MAVNSKFFITIHLNNSHTRFQNGCPSTDAFTVAKMATCNQMAGIFALNTILQKLFGFCIGESNTLGVNCSKASILQCKNVQTGNVKVPTCSIEKLRVVSEFRKQLVAELQ